MTKEEAAIVCAYTGYFIGDFQTFHEYVEILMERPVFTHELADKNLADEISKRAKQDFVSINVK